MNEDEHLNPYEPIGITDDFMFFAVMSDEEIILQEFFVENVDCAWGK